MSEPVEFTRDCEAVEVPAGHTIVIPKGSHAYVTQALGGTYTLQVPSFGGLYRISGRDADAIGKKATQEAASVASGSLEEQVWTLLKTCFDPEIPVNIVDLGLVYDMAISEVANGARRVDVKMTLTAPGCGMGASIANDARQKLLGLPGVEQADVEVVWEPPWSPQMISPEGRQLLGME